MSEDDPLADLYGDKDAYDRRRLANTLEGTLGIDKETGGPIYEEGWNELDGKGKTAAYLLYRAAADALGELSDGNRGIELDEITKTIGLGKSTVSSYLTRLDFVENADGEGGHHIPDSSIGQAIEFLKEKKA